MASFEKIEIVPVTHRNVINFFGMRPKSNYMCWHHRKNDGTFAAVDKTGLLQTWSTTTGKLLEKQVFGITLQKSNIFNFDGYSIFSGSHNDFVYAKGW